MTKKVIDSLKVLLADSYTLYMKTQNFHWNVTGPNFQSLHLLFEAQYTDLATSVDEIAERIRALGAKAPASYSAYIKLATIKEEKNENLTSKQMVTQLVKDQDNILKTLKKVAEAAGVADDEATDDLAVNRMKAHQKNRWMLEATLQ